MPGWSRFLTKLLRTHPASWASLDEAGMSTRSFAAPESRSDPPDGITLLQIEKSPVPLRFSIALRYF